MRFQAVIFDLDGTLLDTLQDIAKSANEVLSKHGFPAHGLDAYREFVGGGVAVLFTRALPGDKQNKNTIAECVAAFRDNYAKNWNSTTRPYDGIPDLLDALAKKRVKLAVLSNKPDHFTKQCVGEFLPDWHFELVLGERDGVARKPDPFSAYEIAEHLGVAPARVLYLGDTAIDMETAIRAGMFPVGALWGFRTAKELGESGASALIERPLELLDYLDDSG